MKSIFTALRQDRLLLLMLAVLALLTALPTTYTLDKIPRYAALVDWPTIAALTGLLMLTKALELSGVLHRLGLSLVARLDSERSAALWLVLAAAVLSTVLTNDVALFVVVPLTLGVCRMAAMPAARLVVFEALAVNAGSSLTPIGNPQNLFLWQRSGVSFAGFVMQMLPLVLLLMAALLLLTCAAFGSRALQLREEAPAPPLDRLLMFTALLLFPLFLIATDAHQAIPAVLALLLVFLLTRPTVLRRLDWGLLLVFVLMFIDLRLVASLELVRKAMTGLQLGQPVHLYFVAMGASQIVSNVPAVIAVAEYAQDWRILAYGVNIGGFGLVHGSLANLIALRLAGDSGAWRTFHAFSLPCLLVAAALGYLLLFIFRV